jgi:REP element-mobilizing transposase RayT
MANSYTQIHIQAVFVVSNRQSLILPSWEDELYKYITSIVQKYDHKMLAINGVQDHTHLFFGMRPTQSISDLMKEVKESASRWINERGFAEGKFSWQSGYGAFSYSKSHVERVIRYVLRQKEHHKKKTFLEEYIQLLEAFGIEYDVRYLFKPVL